MGTSDQKYNISFQVVDHLPPSDPITISWGIIEQVRIPENEIEIDEILENLENFQNEGDWPFVENIEELTVMNEQPKTDVQVRFFFVCLRHWPKSFERDFKIESLGQKCENQIAKSNHFKGNSIFKSNQIFNVLKHDLNEPF